MLRVDRWSWRRECALESACLIHFREVVMHIPQLERWISPSLHLSSMSPYKWRCCVSEESPARTYFSSNLHRVRNQGRRAPNNVIKDTLARTTRLRRWLCTRNRHCKPCRACVCVGWPVRTCPRGCQAVHVAHLIVQTRRPAITTQPRPRPHTGNDSSRSDREPRHGTAASPG